MAQRAEAADTSSSSLSGNPWCEQLCSFPIEDKSTHTQHMYQGTLKVFQDICMYFKSSLVIKTRHTEKPQNIQGFSWKKMPAVPKPPFFVIVPHSFFLRGYVTFK